MAKKSTKSPVKDLKRKPAKKPRVIPFEKAMEDTLLLGLLISGTKSREDAEKLATKIREYHLKRVVDHGKNRYMQGIKYGKEYVQSGLRELIGAASEEHSHSIS